METSYCFHALTLQSLKNNYALIWPKRNPDIISRVYLSALKHHSKFSELNITEPELSKT